MGEINDTHLVVKVTRSGQTAQQSDSQDSSSDSDRSASSSPPSEDDIGVDAEPQKSTCTPNSAEFPETDKYCGIPYVKLNENYDRWLCWSNDPNRLYLATYFDPEVPENLANSYNVKGLCPLVKEDDSDIFILRDDKCRYYYWDAWEGELLRFKDAWIEGLASKEVVEYFIINMSWAEEETAIIYRDREID